MHKKQVLKSLLAVSAVAAMLGSFGVQAQSGQAGSSAATTQSGGDAPAAAGATGAAKAKLSSADRKALTDMAMSNMAEIETGKLAVSKSQNADIKAFAQQMIDDHTKAQAEVASVAQAKGVTLPTELDAKHKAKGAMLEKLSGEEFDRAYLKQSGMADHRDTHGKLKKGMKSAKDADVKALASKMNPVVEQHLKAAEQLNASRSRSAVGTSGTPTTESGK